MQTNYFKSTLVLAALLAFTTCLSAQKTQTQNRAQYTTQSDGSREQVHIIRNGKSYQLEFTNDKLTTLAIDGVSIPEAKWGEYDAFIKDVREQLKRDREQAEKDRAQAEKDRIQAGKDRAQAEKDRDKAKLDREQADKDRAQATRDREQAQLDRVQADRDREQALKDRAQAEKDREQAQRDRVQAEKDRARAAEDRKLLDDLASELVNDKLITDTKALHTLTLNTTGMTVNGQKQPDSVAKKYQEKYSRFAKAGMDYRIDGTTRQFSVSSVMEAE